MIELKNIEKVDDRTRDALIEKCQENGWVRRGGYDWQDDPYLEEYPYHFTRVNDIEELRGIFASGNYAIRQGFLYDDLAFIQQVNGGDEWWTLKQVSDEGLPTDWLDFESWSFEHDANLSHGNVEPKDFINDIRSMQMATPEQCKRLDYTLPDTAPEWGFATAEEIDFSGNPQICRVFSAQHDGYELKVYERPSFEGYALEIYDPEAKCLIEHSEGHESALDAAKHAGEQASHYMKNDIHAPIASRDLEPLAAKAQAAMLASASMSKSASVPSKDAPGI